MKNSIKQGEIEVVKPLVRPIVDFWKERLPTIIEKMVLHAYWVAKGHQKEIRIRISGVKGRRTVCPRWNYGLQRYVISSYFVISQVTADRSDEHLYPEKNGGQGQVRDLLLKELDRIYGKQVQEMVDRAIELAGKGAAADAQLARNIARSEAIRRQHAIERLSHEMMKFDFTKDEILEAWEMTTVAKVQES